MQERKVKPGWKELGIIGLIYLPLGLLFLGLGAAARLFGWGDTDRESLIFLCVFGTIGGIFFLVGAVFLGVDLHRRRAVRRAVELGRVVMADVTAVNQVGNVTTSAGHPWVVECQFMDPDTGALHVARSHYLKFNPAAALEGRQVPVYVDPDGGKYGIYVDIDAVLPEVVLHN